LPARSSKRFVNAAGAEIVFAVRRDRASDSWFKRSSADFFYHLIN